MGVPTGLSRAGRPSAPLGYSVGLPTGPMSCCIASGFTTARVRTSVKVIGMADWKSPVPSLPLALFARLKQHSRRRNLPSTDPGNQICLGYSSSVRSVSVRSKGIGMVSEPGESGACVASP